MISNVFPPTMTIENGVIINFVAIAFQSKNSQNRYQQQPLQTVKSPISWKLSSNSMISNVFLPITTIESSVIINFIEIAFEFENSQNLYQQQPITMVKSTISWKLPSNSWRNEIFRMRIHVKHGLVTSSLITVATLSFFSFSVLINLLVFLFFQILQTAFLVKCSSSTHGTD